MAPKIMLLVKTSEDGKDSLRTLRVLATIAVVGVLLGVGQAAAESPDGSLMLSGGSIHGRERHICAVR
jgi:hypothetical protein